MSSKNKNETMEDFSIERRKLTEKMQEEYEREQEIQKKREKAHRKFQLRKLAKTTMITSEVYGRITSESNTISSKNLHDYRWYSLTVAKVPSIMCFGTIQDDIVPYWLHKLTLTALVRYVPEKDLYELRLLNGDAPAIGVNLLTIGMCCTILTPATIAEFDAFLPKRIKNINLDNYVPFESLREKFSEYYIKSRQDSTDTLKYVDIGGDKYMRLTGKKLEKLMSEKLMSGKGPGVLKELTHLKYHRSERVRISEFVDPDHSFGMKMIRNGMLALNPTSVLGESSTQSMFVNNISLPTVFRQIRGLEAGQLSKSELFKRWGVGSKRGNELLVHFKEIKEIFEGDSIHDDTPKELVLKLCDYVLLKDRTPLNEYIRWCTLKDLSSSLAGSLYIGRTKAFVAGIRNIPNPYRDMRSNINDVSRRGTILRAVVNVERFLTIQNLEGNLLCPFYINRSVLATQTYLHDDDICILLINPTGERIHEAIDKINAQYRLENPGSENENSGKLPYSHPIYPLYSASSTLPQNGPTLNAFDDIANRLPPLPGSDMFNILDYERPFIHPTRIDNEPIITTENVTSDGEKRLKELLEKGGPIEIKENKKTYNNKIPMKTGKRIDDEPAGKKMKKENKEAGKKEDEKD